MSKKIKILYLDDEPVNVQLFEIVFSQKHEVITAYSGNEGLKLLKTNAVDIVISDMKMPKMTGLEFITIAQEMYPDKKYYILTGYDVTKQIQNAIDSGLIIKYFKKPFNMDEIESSINEVLKA